MQPPSNGAQMLQLSLQQNSPGPQIVSLHGSPPQSSVLHGVSGGRHIPPQYEQHVVPSMQSIAAHGSVGIGAGTQTPPQSAPPVAGSQLSRGSSMQTNPSGQGTPAMPPQNMPGIDICPDTDRRVARIAVAVAAAARTARRERARTNIFVHWSNRSLSIAPSQRAHGRVAASPSTRQAASPFLIPAAEPAPPPATSSHSWLRQLLFM
jgi:hypothetical protein